MQSTVGKIGRVIVGKAEPGEDLVDVVTELVKKHEIKAGLINIIGAFEKFTIGYFDLDTNEYQFKTFDEKVELLSTMGNISYNKETDEPIIHLHTMVGKSDYSIMGGHLSQPSIISVTGEIFIYEISQKLHRAVDDKFDLTLLDLE
ncbi:MAG: PPC domain-containing DNA-binding protein [Promethearchaeia archaeon]